MPWHNLKENVCKRKFCVLGFELEKKIRQKGIVNDLMGLGNRKIFAGSTESIQRCEKT